MIYKIILPLIFAITLATQCVAANKKDGYVVVASHAVAADEDWQKVVDVLARRHKAEVLIYDERPDELREKLQSLSPRYVAVIEKPERLDRELVMQGHRLSRTIDDDIYADYLWGIITGYTAEDAMRVVENSSKPYVIHTALNTTGELSDSRLFEHIAYIADGGTPGGWGEKTPDDKNIKRYTDVKWEMLDKWVTKYKEIDPDLLITSSHATEKNLEMPFSLGNLKAKGGRLYADFITPEFLDGTHHPRVYFAAGNCLIGNVNRNKESMAIGWISGMDATSMVGYVVPTWYGRNGWGGLKYWASNAGRFTLAEALYLNQQDMLHTENEWYAEMTAVDYPFEKSEFGQRSEFIKRFIDATGHKPTKDQEGYVYDRDVVVLYGDPAWDVKLHDHQPAGYSIGFKIKGKTCEISITTDDNFQEAAVKGQGIKEEHVNDLPFAIFFPKRLPGARLAEGQTWKVAVAEDFLLIYDYEFEKNNKYKVILDIN